MLKRQKRLSRYAVCLCIFFSAVDVFAWSKQGHVFIVEAALVDLPEASRKKIESIAYKFVRSTHTRAFKVLVSEFPKVANVSLIAAWPDTIRHQRVDKLFSEYGSGRVPAALRQYQQQDTRRWHYANRHYWHKASGVLLKAGESHASVPCSPTPDNGLLLSVWADLLAAYAEVTDDSDRAIVLAFLLHLLTDAYQPLHLMAGIDSKCQSDFGGNRVCLTYAANRDCKLNLHSLWDRGFSLFSTGTFTPIIDKDVIDASRLKQDIRKIENWYFPGVEQAAFIYGDSLTTKPVGPYAHRSRELVRLSLTYCLVTLRKLFDELPG